MRAIYRQAIRAASVGLVINLALGLAKLVGGVLSGSYAMISDAVNSLGDVATSLVVIAALAFSQRPADAGHPYGHTRAEAVAASNVALLIVLSALMVGWEAFSSLVLARAAPRPVPPLWTLVIAGANVVIKEALYHYKLQVGRSTRSAALIANAWDHRGDALSAGVVLVSLAVVRWAGPTYAFADQLGALIVVAAITAAGISLFRKTASQLMDAQADAEVIERVRAISAAVAGVRAIETLRVRETGLELLADLHVEVDPALSVAEGHDIAHRVKDALLEALPNMRDVLVHVEPALQRPDSDRPPKRHDQLS